MAPMRALSGLLAWFGMGASMRQWNIDTTTHYRTHRGAGLIPYLPALLLVAWALARVVT